LLKNGYFTTDDEKRKFQETRGKKSRSVWSVPNINNKPRYLASHDSYKIYSEKLIGRQHLGDKNIDRMIILK
jgi:hypothetical protein